MKTKESNKKKIYHFFYDGMPIPKSIFLAGVPDNWEDKVENSEFSWGYYNAIGAE